MIEMKNKIPIILSLVLGLLFFSQSVFAVNYTNFTSFLPMTFGFTNGVVIDLAWNNNTLDEYAVIGNYSNPTIYNFFVIANSSDATTKCSSGSITYNGYLVEYSQVAYRQNVTNGGDYIVSGSTANGDWILLKMNRTCDIVWSSGFYSGSTFGSYPFIPIVIDKYGDIEVSYQQGMSYIAWKKISGISGNLYSYSNSRYPAYNEGGRIDNYNLIYNEGSDELLGLYSLYACPCYQNTCCGSYQSVFRLNASNLATLGDVKITPWISFSWQPSSSIAGNSGELYSLTFDGAGTRILRVDKFATTLSSTYLKFGVGDLPAPVYCSGTCITKGTSIVFDSSVSRLYLMGTYLYSTPDGSRWIPFIIELDYNLGYVHTTVAPSNLLGTPFQNMTTFFSKGSIDYGKNVFLGGSYALDPAFMWWTIGTGLYPNVTPPTPVCGDLTCSIGETCITCPIDCGTCPYGNFTDNFDDESNWSNSSMCSETGLPYYVSSNSMTLITKGGDKFVHTINSSLYVPTPSTFSVQVKYIGSDHQSAWIKFKSKDCNNYFSIEINFQNNEIGYYSGGTCSYLDHWIVPSPVTFSEDTWYNITYLNTNPAKLYIDGVDVGFGMSSLSGCSPMTYLFLGAYAPVYNSTQRILWKEVSWTTGATAPPYDFNYIDVAVYDRFKFDIHGCPVTIPRSTVSVYNGLTMEFIDQMTPDTLDFSNCCNVDGISYGCKGGRITVPNTLSQLYVVAEAPAYTTQTDNFTIMYQYSNGVFFLSPTNIGRFDLSITDSKSLAPMTNVMGCMFYANDTLVEQCVWTSGGGISGGGKLWWYLDRNENYYFTITGDGYYTYISPNFTFTGDRHSSAYMLKMPPNQNWYVTLTANASGTIPAQDVKLKVLVNGVTPSYMVSSLRKINAFEAINATYDNVYQNPFFIIQNMSYCGNNELMVGVGANSTYINGTIARWDYQESNRLNITISGGCDMPPSWDYQANTTPMVNGTQAFPPELTFLEFFFSPLVVTSIFVFGIGAVLSQQIGGSHKGVIFIIAVMLMFFALALGNSIPMWIIVVLGLIFGGIIFLVLKNQSGESGGAK